jgi:hypothetical protein
MSAPPRPVTLNVYDVAPPPPPEGAASTPAAAAAATSAAPPPPLPADRAPPLIARLNGLGRAAGLGGVFHGGIAVDGKEYAFGYCERGTGVYATRPRANPLYTYRESVDLGETRLPPDEVAAVVRRLRDAWPGGGYDLLRRNCCHFCDALARELGVSPPPAWLNRLANAGEVTAAAAAEAAAVARAVAAEAGRRGWQGLEALRRAAAGLGGGAAASGEAPAGGNALLRAMAAQDAGLFWGGATARQPHQPPQGGGGGGGPTRCGGGGGGGGGGV